MPVMRTVFWPRGVHFLPSLMRGRKVSPSAANLTFAVHTLHFGAFVPTTHGTLAAWAEGTAKSAVARTMVGRRVRIRMLAPIGAACVNPVRTHRYLDGCRVRDWGTRRPVPDMGELRPERDVELGREFVKLPYVRLERLHQRDLR